MKLPHGESAYVPQPKLTEYLLSETHPIGQSKARLLRAAGFNESNVSALEQALLAIARSEDVSETEETGYGVKYVIEGSLQTPGGDPLRMRTVWVIEPEENQPRFVTAYPA